MIQLIRTLQRNLTLLAVLALLLPALPARPILAAPLTTVDATLTLNPAADAYVDQGAANSNFGGARGLIAGRSSVLAVLEQHALMRFDLSLLPAGAIINRAELRLNQTGTPGSWTVDLYRSLTAWSDTGVTWNTKPLGTAYYSGLDVPDPATAPTVVWDMTDLVREWAYRTSLNFGLEIVPGPGATVNRTFSSMEDVTPPELVIDYSAPPTNLIIAEDAAPVTLDGQCDTDQEYAKAEVVKYVDADGLLTTVYLKHDADNLYLCFVAPHGRYPLRYFGVYLDTDNGREKYATADDYALHIGVETGLQSSFEGTGNPNGVYTPTLRLDWKAVASSNDQLADSAEYIIPRTLFARACTSPFGLAFYHRDVNDNGVDYGLPANLVYELPEFWLEAALANPGCIRVCSETAAPCGSAPTATVYDAATGASYATDSDGYVITRPPSGSGVQLWALMPVTPTAQSTIYYTSGDPQEVTDAAFAGPNAGIMSLVVTAAKPLLVQDLAVSAQWFVEGDPARAQWLRDSLLAASDYLYAITDGQFALGKVTVHQSYDDWADADVQLHLNNVFQPRAVIGGVVATDTVDIEPTLPISYTPGHIFIGSAWNRFGKPPGQPVHVDGALVPTSTLTLDWSMALAHELGHYLLYLFDTYTDVDGNASEELAAICTGTAMGDIYEPTNHGFVYDADFWTDKCKLTEAYATLNGRTEWATIKGWYPWVVQPTSFVTGPDQPAGLTAVTFVTPTTVPNEPATSQLFDLAYVDNETNSAEARVFVLRNQRVLEQGKPAKGSNQIQLIDAQLGDELCVYDINDNAEGSETPRHQFGCETIKPNDALLQMTKDESWAPLVALHQIGPQQLAISVTQTITEPVGVPLLATVYPEHGAALATIILNGDANLHTGVIDFAAPLPPLYVQLNVAETPADPATPRGVIADRGTGGSGAFGPASRAGKVFTVSSDHAASYESEAPFALQPGESIAWQSMPGTPPLPAQTAIRGQSYRLDAYPPALVDDGEVSIRFVEPIGAVNAAQASAVAQSSAAVYFWDGTAWLQLNTTLTTLVNGEDGERLATAPSQGNGVYAVLINTQQTQLYLPFILR